MNEDIISIILRAENDYHSELEKTTLQAEEYEQDSRTKQRAYQEKLRGDFQTFEKEQRDEFDKTLYESMQKMDSENNTIKEQMKACQKNMAEIISERLKKEVLSLYGDS